MLAGTATLADGTTSKDFELNYTLVSYENEELTAIFDLSSNPLLLSEALTAFVSSDTELSDLINVTIVS